MTLEKKSFPQITIQPTFIVEGKISDAPFFHYSSISFLITHIYTGYIVVVNKNKYGTKSISLGN
jgi:hypothetical protein